jgi:integrase
VARQISPAFQHLVWNRRTYQNHFDRAVEKAGLPPEFTPHSLRHCYASIALANGIPITEVSRWLGRRRIEVTHQIYGNSRELHQPGEKPQVSRSRDRWNSVSFVLTPAL